jgi:hypothetical protein
MMYEAGKYVGTGSNIQTMEFCKGLHPLRARPPLHGQSLFILTTPYIVRGDVQLRRAHVVDAAARVHAHHGAAVVQPASFDMEKVQKNFGRGASGWTATHLPTTGTNYNNVEHDAAREDPQRRKGTTDNWMNVVWAAARRRHTSV